MDLLEQFKSFLNLQRIPMTNFLFILTILIIENCIIGLGFYFFYTRKQNKKMYENNLDKIKVDEISITFNVSKSDFLTELHEIGETEYVKSIGESIVRLARKEIDKF